MSGWRNKPAEAKHRGLVNHGATCYLNSVLQVLFMTEEFREAIIRPTSTSEQYIDNLLKGLFEELLKKTENLSYYTNRSVDPHRILKALGVNNVYEQQDAAEYFERILRNTSENAAKIFHGRLSHRTSCLTCQTPTDSEGPFWHLPLELEDSPGGNYSVENGIKMFFTPTIFDGDNQMYCDNCDAKVDATRKYVITRHPDVLLLMLKRFDFSYQFMSYIKINRNAEIPHTIEIPENQSYELYAVVDHSGDLRGGHYHAVIQSKDEGGKWFIFDDSSVTQLAVNPFPGDVNVTQSTGAYLLFYRKKDCVISDLCSVRDYNPNIIEGQNQKKNLQSGDDTDTLYENISLPDDKKRKMYHMSFEAEPEVRNPEKREINEPQENNQYEQRLLEEQTDRERQTERLSQDEITYSQDIIMKDAEDQEENRNQLTGEGQIQGLVAGETEPTKVENMQADINYDNKVESAEPAAFQENPGKQQVLPEERTDEVRGHETENSNELITTSEKTGTAEEAENNKLLPAENLRYNYNQVESAALNKLEEIEQIGEGSPLKESISAQEPDNIPQCLLTPYEPHFNNEHQMRNEMTVNVSKTQETEDIDETHIHKDRPKVDEGGKSKQKRQITGKKNRPYHEKKENQDNTDRTGEDQVAAYSDSPQPHHDDESTADRQKKHTKQNVQTSHDAENELEVKKTQKRNYKMAATLTGNQEADRDGETSQENFQSYRNKGSEDAEVRIQDSNQAAFENKTITVDIRELSPGGKCKRKLLIKTISEETTTVNNSNNRTIGNEGNVDCNLEQGDLPYLPSSIEDTTTPSEPLLQKQNPTSKENTGGANEDKYRMNFSSETDLEAQQRRHDMKNKCTCSCACVVS